MPTEVALAEEAADNASQPWIAARDLAVLLLLYGAGLRVGEAMAWTGAVLPIGPTISVTGKRSKSRIVPIIPTVAGCDRRLSGALPLSDRA